MLQASTLCTPRVCLHVNVMASFRTQSASLSSGCTLRKYFDESVLGYYFHVRAALFYHSLNPITYLLDATSFPYIIISLFSSYRAVSGSVSFLRFSSRSLPIFVSFQLCQFSFLDQNDGTKLFLDQSFGLNYFVTETRCTLHTVICLTSFTSVQPRLCNHMQFKPLNNSFTQFVR